MSKNALPPPVTFAEAGERVRCLCAIFNASETSGGRTVARNAAVNGAKTSKHLISRGCLGWDLVPDDPANKTYLADCAKLLGFYVEVEDNHVHLQSVPPDPAPPSA